MQKNADRLAKFHPSNVLKLHRLRIENLRKSLQQNVVAGLKQRESRLNAIATHLHAIGPENVLKRGYTITTIKSTGQIVRSASQVKVGEKIQTRLADGTVDSVVGDARQMELFE